MPFIEVRGLRFYYERRGSGPRLLFISGTGGDLRRQPSIFDSPLGARFDILAYDQRGLGQTDKPEVPHTMADYADDAAGLLDAIGWERCLVLGISFGGMVAQEFALRHPQRVERMVLACSSSGGAGGHSYPLHEFQDLPVEERARRSIAVSDLRWDAEWRAKNPERYQAILEQTIAGLSVGAGEPGRAEGQRRQFEARKQHDTYERLPALTMPVYVCGGKYDGIAPPANLEALASRLPNATLEFFEGGHLFIYQDRRAFERIAAFLLDR